MHIEKKEEIIKKTKFVLIWSNLISEPFTSLQSYIPYILTKTLHASSFWIVLVTMLRPVVSIFSFAWSSRIIHLKESLRSNLVQAGLLSRIPFLFFPIISHPAYVVFAAAMYVLFSRASIPAWMEILKLNLEKEKRDRLFSFSWVLGYIEGILIALGIGWLLDAGSNNWKFLFALSALFGMSSVIMHYLMPINEKKPLVQEEDISLSTFYQLVQPWKDCILFIKSRPDFAKFQWGFMAGGFGVMMMQPALPFFFKDTLQLSYIDFSIALTIAKGLGIVVSSPLWTRAISKQSILNVSSIVCLGFALFPLFMIFSPIHLLWLYVAYLIYGIAQGGSHLIWHLSGPIFSKDEESSRYSGVNVIMVGIRGLIAPILGGIISQWISPLLVFVIGCICCLYGFYFLYRHANNHIH
ncbi:MAG: MFS transporter [Chlamydiales bacterium]|nr:MFS transporter [Chlamydiales bacterium]